MYRIICGVLFIVSGSKMENYTWNLSHASLQYRILVVVISTELVTDFQCQICQGQLVKGLLSRVVGTAERIH